jgi:hypothetical protein
MKKLLMIACRVRQQNYTIKNNKINKKTNHNYFNEGQFNVFQYNQSYVARISSFK